MKTDAAPYGKAALSTAIVAVLAGWSTAGLGQESLVLEEVIVTAQKRAASVQDIAATVNVVTGESIEKFATFTFADIEQQTAGLSLDVPNARNSKISMRGIGTDPEAGTPPAVDVYWNDMNVRPDVAFTQLYDLERLEILRGPQGTLQGRTSPAGAINLITRRADLAETSGYLQLSVSDDDGINGQVAVSVPLIENVLAARIAAVYDESHANGVDNITTNDDADQDATSARLSVSWAPTDTFDAHFTYQWLDNKRDGHSGLEGSDKLGERPSFKADDRKALGKTDNYGDLEYDIANLTLVWQLGDLELTSVTGYNDSTKDSRTENDRAFYVTNPDAPTWQNANTEVESWSQEIRLASSDNDFWDYMFGVYYIDQETDTSFLANTTLTIPVPTFDGISFATDGAIPVDNEESGVFSFNTFYLTDTLQMELGLRWSKFERYRAADVFFAGLNYNPGFLPDEVIEQIFGGNFPINAVSDKNKDSDDDTVTGALSLRYDWTDDVSVYLSYNRGYRPGGISIVPDPDVQYLPNGEDDLLYDEEESDAIELGFKSRLLDGRATLNGAVYYQKFDGYFGFVRGVQVLDDTGNPVDIAGGLVYNGDANLWGVELDGQVLLTESWSAGGTLSYAKGEWDGAEAPCNEREPGEALGSCDIDGEALGGEPEFSLSLQSEFFVPMEGMEWYLRGLFKYTDERDNIDASAGINGVTDEFDSYSTLNLYTGLRSSDYRWDLSLWAKNVFDEDIVTFQTASDQYDLAVSGGSYLQTNVLQERVLGVTARYNF
jgi:outer membrane receptor protein involved in Fe transport